MSSQRRGHPGLYWRQRFGRYVAADHERGASDAHRAARFVAQTTRETALDTRAMRHTDPIRLIEVMGRHAGWLPGAAWLAKQAPEDAPQLVYVPERPREIEQIVADVREVHQQ